jgi:hypothetical protein
MQIILPLLPDPTDIVVQGEQTVIYAPSASMLSPVLQGQVIGDATLDSAVPRGLIGQHDWYGIKPRTTGPKVMSGGELVMLDIGQKPVDVFVDPIQRWLSSVFQVDKAGFMLSLYDAKTIGAPEAFAQFMISEPETMGNPVVSIPRGAISRSGLAKRTTLPVLPDSFGRHTLIDDFVETTRRWFVNGVTRDGAGAALDNCRVIVMRVDKIGINPDILANPIEADIMSDAGGNYSVQTANNLPRQVLGYKAGGTDVAGVTVNTVIPEDG